MGCRVQELHLSNTESDAKMVNDMETGIVKARGQRTPVRS